MEWISVKDRLPEFEEKCLAYYFPKSPVMEGRIIGILRRIDAPDKKMLRGLTDANQFTMAAEVTHWMPLPEPPNSDIEGKDNGG